MLLEARINDHTDGKLLFRGSNLILDRPLITKLS